jgi:hypothetical protein
MWNENAPLELLKELPTVLNEANLARIQSVIDYDKFINSTECGYDLCGSYAPFCAGCDKSGNNPCAVAYIKMKQSQGYDVKIESASQTEAAEEEVKPVAEEVAVQPQPEVEEVAEPEPQPVDKPAPEKKKSIRIAIARRRR